MDASTEVTILCRNRKYYHYWQLHEVHTLIFRLLMGRFWGFSPWGGQVALTGLKFTPNFDLFGAGVGCGDLMKMLPKFRTINAPQGHPLRNFNEIIRVCVELHIRSGIKFCPSRSRGCREMSFKFSGLQFAPNFDDH